MSDEEHSRRFSTYGKYLAFDCDDPPNVQSVIRAAKDYDLLISNHLFEIWLLMHFEDVKVRLSKREIYRRLSDHLHSIYSKGHRGKTREIVQNGDIEKAIDNAKALELQYVEDSKSVFTNIKEMNPYTSVHMLLRLMLINTAPIDTGSSLVFERLWTKLTLVVR